MAATATKAGAAGSVIRIRLRGKLVRIHESRRRNKAVRYIKELVARHHKSVSEYVKISRALNEYLNANSTNIYKPIPIQVNRKDGGIIEASIQGEKPAQEAKVQPQRQAQPEKPAASAHVQG
ncbi:MAG: hypothetical protein QXF01_02805, partial [Candidatus Micrarchaeaceae archaeon]